MRKVRKEIGITFGVSQRLPEECEQRNSLLIAMSQEDQSDSKLTG